MPYYDKVYTVFVHRQTIKSQISQRILVISAFRFWAAIFNIFFNQKVRKLVLVFTSAQTGLSFLWSVPARTGVGVCDSIT